LKLTQTELDLAQNLMADALDVAITDIAKELGVREQQLQVDERWHDDFDRIVKLAVKKLVTPLIYINK